MSDEDELQSIAQRSSPDYLKLLSHLTKLCAYRIQIHRDLDQLRKTEQRALADPETFVRDLQAGNISFPARIEIPAIPAIDHSQPEDPLPSSSSTLPETANTSEKPQTVVFWTNEEQKQLEDLLIKYPPEAVESKRFAKIAEEMDNRTPKQIASRVQKYFKKLHQANLLVSGSSKRNKHRSMKLERPSTFFPDGKRPVDEMMKETEDVAFVLKKKTVALLKQVRIAKISPSTIESNRSCESCNETVFKGASWSCHDCDTCYCPDCLMTQLLDKSFNHFDHDFGFS